ncbi:alpha/beta hydrolase [Mucilaginibacter kameinonensis]|uniref:alpha/beta hydrolase n=1 Tax=Mucilaginibacter kameinonensis TaxID=452286 RepID=UPI000EF7AC1D|nr:alpha/beta hydrolase [Mucilaginibacter kameinonensis]
MKTNINVVLVHGAFGEGSHWQFVIPALAAKGYTVRAVQLPLITLAEDIQRTTDMIASLEGPTLLVGHSYGGMVISGAGNHPSVKGLVYIAAFAPEEGESAFGLLQERPAPAGATAIAPGPSGLLYVNYDKFHEAFCEGVSDELALVMASAQKPISGEAFGGPSGAPAWKEKPSWYQVSDNDKMIQPEAETFFAERIKAKKTIHLDAGHASMASHPQQVIELILEAAEAIA